MLQQNQLNAYAQQMTFYGAIKPDDTEENAQIRKFDSTMAYVEEQARQ